MSLSLWTVYRHPIDHPGLFVARRFVLARPTRECVTGKTLDEVRDKLPPGLVMLARSPGDEPHIMETWL